MTEREFAIEVVARLQKAGHRALWAGGCVRDELLGFEPADYDIATDARPEQVKTLFRRCLFIGASFGVVEVLGPRGPDGEWLKVQVATFRSDGTYSDGRRPDAVTYSSPEEDAQRRDFTINGMFLDPVTNQIIDYVGGAVDLKAKILRAIGDPAARFEEDKLRILRAVRMAARFELAIDPATLAAAKRMANEIRVVSAERIAEELRKLLTNRHRSRGMRLMREFDLVEPILPELLPTTGWDRALKLLEVLSGPLWPKSAAVSFPLAFAAVLRDVGTHGAADIGQRLRLSNAEIDRIVWLVRHWDILCSAERMRQSELYPFLIHPGIGELLALHRAIAAVQRMSAEHVEFCEAILREKPMTELNPPPLLTGDDLRTMGLTPGPAFKRILDALRVAQLDGAVRTREQAETFMRNIV